MKRPPFLLFIFFLAAIPGCNSNYNESKNSVQAIAKSAKLICPDIHDRSAMHSMAMAVIERHDNDNIWNLADVDTTGFMVSENYYTNSQTRDRLVVMDGTAGSSAGSAHRLLMLFSCPDSFRLLFAAQVGEIDSTAILDLNGDGIVEIVERSGATWMGECTESYSIFNFKDREKNLLFQAVSRSALDCGSDGYGQLYSRGDTLETHFDCSLVKMINNRYGVRQIRTVKVHNGGKSDEDIMKYLRIIVDTSTTVL